MPFATIAIAKDERIWWVLTPTRDMLASQSTVLEAELGTCTCSKPCQDPSYPAESQAMESESEFEKKLNEVTTVATEPFSSHEKYYR